MSTTPTIPDSARLRYRLMNVQDARDKELLWELDQDPEVMHFLNHGQPTTWEELENFMVPRVAAFTVPAEGLGIWEAADKHSGEYLGWIIARYYRFDKPERETDNLELGWRFKRACWGKGIATEAAHAIMTVLARNPATRAFSALADPANLASIGVMKNIGMRLIDERTHIVPGRPPYACVYYEAPSPNFNGHPPV
jgi:RimJ/RimL family protein N-acetyltransferase